MFVAEGTEIYSNMFDVRLTAATRFCLLIRVKVYLFIS